MKEKIRKIIIGTGFYLSVLLVLVIILQDGFMRVSIYQYLNLVIFGILWFGD